MYCNWHKQTSRKNFYTNFNWFRYSLVRLLLIHALTNAKSSSYIMATKQYLMLALGRRGKSALWTKRAQPRFFFNPSWTENSSLGAAAPPGSAGRRWTLGAAAAPQESAGRRWGSPGAADRAGKGRGRRRRWAERGRRTREQRPSAPPVPRVRRDCATAGGPASRIFSS